MIGFCKNLDKFWCMVKLSKTAPGTLPHLRLSFLQRLVTVESCKGLHLICNKVLGSAPDFYVSYHYVQSVLTFTINMKIKQIFNKPGVYYKSFDNFTSQLCLLPKKM